MLLLSLGVLQPKMVDTASLQAADPTARKPVASIIAAIIVPLGWLRMARTAAC
jgi:hypothetical protein